MKHMLSLMDWSGDDLDKLIKLAIMIKGDQGSYRTALDGQTLAMIFEKPSTRTRVSFEIGMHQLGGKGLFLSSSDMQLGRGETIADTARVLGRYCDGIMARVFEHAESHRGPRPSTAACR
jgi:ornithine carbamoyltransferase